MFSNKTNQLGFLGGAGGGGLFLPFLWRVMILVRRDIKVFGQSARRSAVDWSFVQWNLYLLLKRLIVVADK